MIRWIQEIAIANRVNGVGMVGTELEIGRIGVVIDKINTVMNFIVFQGALGIAGRPCETKLFGRIGKDLAIRIDKTCFL